MWRQNSKLALRHQKQSFLTTPCCPWQLTWSVASQITSNSEDIYALLGSPLGDLDRHFARPNGHWLLLTSFLIETTLLTMAISLKHCRPSASMKQHSPVFLALFLVTTYVVFGGLCSFSYISRLDHLAVDSHISREFYFGWLYVFGWEKQL